MKKFSKLGLIAFFAIIAALSVASSAFADGGPGW
jgi:hypothetical protein